MGVGINSVHFGSLSLSPPLSLSAACNVYSSEQPRYWSKSQWKKAEKEEEREGQVFIGLRCLPSMPMGSVKDTRDKTRMNHGILKVVSLQLAPLNLLDPVKIFRRPQGGPQ